MKIFRLGLLALTVVGSLFVPYLIPELAADEPTPPTVSDLTSVILVEIPVQVLRNGEPVRGLQAEDFEIYDNGKARTLSGFDVVDLTGPIAEEPHAYAIGTGGRRHFVLFFDLSNTRSGAVQKGIEAARTLLADGLHPSDLVAIGAYSPMVGTRLPVNFTPDRRPVRAALASLEALINHRRDGKKAQKGAKKAKKQGKDEPAEATTPAVLSDTDPLGLTLRDQNMFAARMGLGLAENIGAAGELLSTGTVISGNGEAPLGEHDVILGDMETFYQESNRNVLRDRAFGFLDALSGIADQLAAVRGQKHFLLFSEGIVESSYLEEAEGGRKLREMVAHFRRSGWIMHTIQTGGFAARSDALLNLERAPRTAREAPLSLGAADALAIMARETGGDYYGNFNDLSGAMGEVLADTSLTYVLSFQPSDIALDGAFHRLEVKLRDGTRGTRLLHRPGYYAPRPGDEESPLERSLRTADLLLSNEEGGMLATHALAAPFPKSAASSHVPVLIEVDGPSLLADHEGDTLGLEVFAYALDAAGGVADFFVERPSIEIAAHAEVLHSGGIKLYGDLDLPPGNYRLRVLVREGKYSREALATTPLTVPDLSTEQPALLPPLSQIRAHAGSTYAPSGRMARSRRPFPSLSVTVSSCPKPRSNSPQVRRCRSA